MSGGPRAARPRVVFDFAGVLFHWKPLELLKRLLPGHATDEPSAAFWAEQIFQGYTSDWAEFDRGTIELGPLIDRIAGYRQGGADFYLTKPVAPDELVLVLQSLIGFSAGLPLGSIKGLGTNHVTFEAAEALDAVKSIFSSVLTSL